MKTTLVLLTIFLPLITIAQIDTVDHKDIAWSERRNKYVPWDWNKSWTIKVGYTYSKYHIAEIGIKRTFLVGSSDELYGMQGPAIATEFVFDEKQILFAPKISYEYEFMFLGGKLNAMYYTKDFQTGSFKLRPEIGISLIGYINIFYGYTFNLTNSAFYKQNHSVTLFANIPLLKYRGHRRIKKTDYPTKEKK